MLCFADSSFQADNNDRPDITQGRMLACPAIVISLPQCARLCTPCLLQGQYEMDVATFCERSVDVMGEESDHIHAQALCDAVQVSQVDM